MNISKEPPTEEPVRSTKLSLILGIVLVVVAGIVWWLSRTSRETTPSQRSEDAQQSGRTSEVTEVRTASPNRSTEPPTNASQLQPQAPTTIRDYTSDQNVPIRFWGKVVDQDENPLAGVTVILSARSWGVANLAQLNPSFEEFERATRADGRFELTDAKGDVLTVKKLLKEGYEASPKALQNFGYNISTNHVPDSNNPHVFRMWKKGPPQNLIVHRLSRVGIPCDGTPVTFDLFTNQKVTSNGDLRIRLTRAPLQLASRDTKYDWTATIEVSDGGLIQSTDEFMLLAPIEGYSVVETIAVPKDDPAWSPYLRKQFYVKLRNGTAFGKINISLATDYQPPPAGLTMEVTLNPTGSRSLEQ